MKTRTIIATFCTAILLGLAVLFRYDVRPLDANGYVILRHNRWSGEVERCTNLRTAYPASWLVGCTSYLGVSDESWLTRTLDVVMFWNKKEEPAPPPPPPEPAEP